MHSELVDVVEDVTLPERDNILMNHKVIYSTKGKKVMNVVEI